MSKMSATQLQEFINNCHGSESLRRFSLLTSLHITDGVAGLAEHGGAYWLLDVIASYQRSCMKDPMLQDFQIWTLQRVKGNKFRVICERDTDDVAIRQTIPYSDFPLDSVKLYVENDVICLPGER